MKREKLKERWVINPNTVNLSQLPRFVEVYNDYKHGRVEDILISTVKKSDSKFLTPDTYAYVISNKLFYFLHHWSIPIHGKEHNIYRYLNTLTFDSNKNRDPIQIYRNIENGRTYYMSANHDLYNYNCNSKTVYKSLNKIIKLKQAVDKVAKQKDKRTNISINNLILASMLPEKEALQYLSIYSYSSIKHLADSAEFKHCFKLCHSNTTTDIIYL